MCALEWRLDGSPVGDKLFIVGVGPDIPAPAGRCNPHKFAALGGVDSGEEFAPPPRIMPSATRLTDYYRLAGRAPAG